MLLPGVGEGGGTPKGVAWERLEPVDASSPSQMCAVVGSEQQEGWPSGSHRCRKDACASQREHLRGCPGICPSTSLPHVHTAGGGTLLRDYGDLGKPVACPFLSGVVHCTAQNLIPAGSQRNRERGIDKTQAVSPHPTPPCTLGYRDCVGTRPCPPAWVTSRWLIF